jgi:methylphosphotriester-DNA--protein-cysteine methyltransferase
MPRTWTLIGPDGKPFASARAGTLGAHRGTRIYGRLDCPAALRAIARGGYVRSRVFFLNRAHARAAGYRPCAVCLPEEYAAWKATASARRLRAAGRTPG